MENNANQEESKKVATITIQKEGEPSYQYEADQYYLAVKSGEKLTCDVAASLAFLKGISRETSRQVIEAVSKERAQGDCDCPACTMARIDAGTAQLSDLFKSLLKATEEAENGQPKEVKPNEG